MNDENKRDEINFVMGDLSDEHVEKETTDVPIVPEAYKKESIYTAPIMETPELNERPHTWTVLNLKKRRKKLAVEAGHDF